MDNTKTISLASEKKVSKTVLNHHPSYKVQLRNVLTATRASFPISKSATVAEYCLTSSGRCIKFVLENKLEQRARIAGKSSIKLSLNFYVSLCCFTVKRAYYECNTQRSQWGEMQSKFPASRLEKYTVRDANVVKSMMSTKQHGLHSLVFVIAAMELQPLSSSAKCIGGKAGRVRKM